MHRIIEPSRRPATRSIAAAARPAHLAASVAPLPIPLELELDRIDRVFFLFGGPMRSVYIESTRAALDRRWIQPDREAYLERLASTLPLEATRIDFLIAYERFRCEARQRRERRDAARQGRDDRQRLRRRSRGWAAQVDRALTHASTALRDRLSRFGRPDSGNGDSRFFVSSLLATWVGWSPSRPAASDEESRSTH